MGWRENLGAAAMPMVALSSENINTQNEQNTQKPPDRTPFADIADIAHRNSENDFSEQELPEYQIEPLTHCLHGRKCWDLVSKPPARPLCRLSGEPVFDLVTCPAGRWADCERIALVSRLKKLIGMMDYSKALGLNMDQIESIRDEGDRIINQLPLRVTKWIFENK